jgi:hypothetical protein
VPESYVFSRISISGTTSSGTSLITVRFTVCSDLPSQAANATSVCFESYELQSSG